MVLPGGACAATGTALNMCYGWSLERSGVALHTPRRFRVEGHRVDQEAKVTDNLGDHDNRGKESSARSKVECGLLRPQQPGR